MSSCLRVSGAGCFVCPMQIIGVTASKNRSIVFIAVNVLILMQIKRILRQFFRKKCLPVYAEWYKHEKLVKKRYDLVNCDHHCCRDNGRNRLFLLKGRRKRRECDGRSCCRSIGMRICFIEDIPFRLGNILGYKAVRLVVRVVSVTIEKLRDTVLCRHLQISGLSARNRKFCHRDGDLLKNTLSLQ